MGSLPATPLEYTEVISKAARVGEGLRVFSLVNNAALHDARVIKEARTLLGQGFAVTVFGRLLEGADPDLMHEGLRVRRLSCFDLNSQFSPEHERRVLALFGPVSSLLQLKLERLRGLQQTRTAAQRRYDAVQAAIKANSDRSARPALAAERDASRESLHQAKLSEREYVRNESFYLNYLFYAFHFLSMTHDETPDVIHAHDLHPLAAAVGLARRTGAVLVWDAHEIETERAPPLPPERKAFIGEMERHLLQSVDQVVVCCDSAADFYGERYPGPRPVVVMNAPDIVGSPASEQQLNVRTALALAVDTPLVVYTGGVGLEPRGVHKIVQAMVHLPEAHLAVVGPRKEQHDEWLLGVIQAAGVEDRVHLMPPVLPEQLVSFISAGDVGVCAFQDVTLNHRYALPNKVFEMAFAGLPLCVPDFPDMGRFVTGMQIGRVMDEADPSSIAAAIREILRDPQLYRPDSAKMQRLLDSYGWSVQGDRLIEAYTSLPEKRLPQPEEDPSTTVNPIERLRAWVLERWRTLITRLAPT